MSYEPRKDPYALLDQARFNYRLRQVIFAVLLGLTVMFFWTHRDRLAYGLNTSEPVDLGNAREHWLAKNMDLKARSGQYVRMDGLIPTRYRIGEDGDDEIYFTDYFCPIFNIAVRTTEIPPAQPDFGGRQYLGGFPQEFLRLVQTRRVHVENLHVHASIEGRIYRMDEAPSFVLDMVDFYRPYLDRPVNEAWIVLDGVTPASVRYVWWVALAFVALILVSAWWLMRVRSRLYEMAQNLHRLSDG